MIVEELSDKTWYCSIKKCFLSENDMCNSNDVIIYHLHILSILAWLQIEKMKL